MAGLVTCYISTDYEDFTLKFRYGGLHEKRVVATWNCLEPSQHLLKDPGKPRKTWDEMAKTCVEMALIILAWKFVHFSGRLRYLDCKLHLHRVRPSQVLMQELKGCNTYISVSVEEPTNGAQFYWTWSNTNLSRFAVRRKPSRYLQQYDAADSTYYFSCPGISGIKRKWMHCFTPLNTKRRLLYLRTQFVPHSKHFSSRL